MGGGYFRLTTDQFEEIVNKGFIFVQPFPGRFKKITLDDILISKEDVDKMIKEKRK